MTLRQLVKSTTLWSKQPADESHYSRLLGHVDVWVVSNNDHRFKMRAQRSLCSCNHSRAGLWTESWLKPFIQVCSRFILHERPRTQQEESELEPHHSLGLWLLLGHFPDWIFHLYPLGLNLCNGCRFIRGVGGSGAKAETSSLVFGYSGPDFFCPSSQTWTSEKDGGSAGGVGVAGGTKVDVGAHKMSLSVTSVILPWSPGAKLLYQSSACTPVVQLCNPNRQFAELLGRHVYEKTMKKPPLPESGN